MAAGALFFNDKNEILIVKPSYKNNWEVPGGVVEENESPLQACIREVREELGFKMDTIEFLCVDYGRATSQKSEYLQFIFFGGKLTAKEISSIRLPKDELAEYKFATIAESSLLLSASMSKRISLCLAALKEKKGLYLEDAKKV